jgi:hypothetical protein
MSDYIPTLIGAVGAIAGGAATQCFTLWRESHTSNKARFRDMQFIGGELILTLTEFQNQCEQAATDNGEPHPSGPGGQIEYHPTVNPDELILADIQGKWESLPPELQFRIRELPTKHKHIKRSLTDGYEHIQDRPEDKEFFRRRKHSYRQLANDVDSLVQQLRRLCKFPESQPGWQNANEEEVEKDDSVTPFMHLVFSRTKHNE